MKLLISTLVVLFASLFQSIFSYKEDEPIVIHVIPHSHDDIGWLATLDNYYWGQEAQNDHASVQFTLTTMVQALLSNPDRKFVEVEMGFFTIWWFEQSDKVKADVMTLIENGQLQFINGGWSQNDEAATYYENIIDNMWIGHRFLKNELNVCPNIGWSIDPFGHSAAQSALYSQMGFNGWWFARLDYQDKVDRLKDQNMEWIWNPKQASGKEYPIFTSLNYNHYEPPPNFCFDAFCGDTTPIRDNPLQKGYNVDTRSKELVDYFKEMAKSYKTNHLLHTFGSDFQYTNSEMYYKNLDRLIRYINAHPEDFDNTVIKYSTPGDYLEDIYPLKADFRDEQYDFFPYADNDSAYWTGYFTSRVAGKGAVRDNGRTIQSQRTYLALLKYHNQCHYCNENEDEIENKLTVMEQAMGVLQHHDAITGTEKQEVAYDYQWQLSNGTVGMDMVMSNVINEQIEKIAGIKITEQQHSYNWNNTAIECEVIYDSLIRQESVLMTIYNPTIEREQIISFKVPYFNFNLKELSSNSYLDVEVVCDGIQDCTAYFKATLQSFGLNLFWIEYTKSPKQTTALDGELVNSDNGQLFEISDKKNITLYESSDHFQYNYCTKNKFQLTDKCYTENFDINYNHYFSYQGNGQKSGAYIFRPNEETFEGPIMYSEIKSKKVFSGNLVTVVLMEGTHTKSQVLFVNLDSDYDRVIEIHTFIKSIDISDKKGKEIVIDIESDLKNEQVFYTDTNGLDLLERKLNYRPTWNLTVTQPTSGNYYPINAMIQIRDETTKRMMTLLNDRAQGGTSLREGQLELMIHRRCLYDDGRGVGEPLNETNIQDGEGLVQTVRHYLVFGDTEDYSKELPRQVQFNNDVANLQYFATLNELPEDLLYTASSFPLVEDLPPMMKFYMRYYGSQSNKYLMRLNNMNEFESSQFDASINNLQETTLTANQLLSEWEENKMDWSYSSTKRNLIQKHQKIHQKEPVKEKEEQKEVDQVQEEKLKVLPLEIRTFNITGI